MSNFSEHLFLNLTCAIDEDEGDFILDLGAPDGFLYRVSKSDVILNSNRGDYGGQKYTEKIHRIKVKKDAVFSQFTEDSTRKFGTPADVMPRIAAWPQVDINGRSKTFTETRPNFTALINDARTRARRLAGGARRQVIFTLPGDDSNELQYTIEARDDELLSHSTEPNFPAPSLAGFQSDVTGRRQIAGPIFEGRPVLIVYVETQVASALEVSLSPFGNYQCSGTIEAAINGKIGGRFGRGPSEGMAVEYQLLTPTVSSLTMIGETGDIDGWKDISLSGDSSRIFPYIIDVGRFGPQSLTLRLILVSGALQQFLSMSYFLRRV